MGDPLTPAVVGHVGKAVAGKSRCMSPPPPGAPLHGGPGSKKITRDRRRSLIREFYKADAVVDRANYRNCPVTHLIHQREYAINLIAIGLE